MTKLIKDDELHKIIQFEEQYELSDPKQWSYLDSVEGRESVSCAFSKIDFKDKLQNMYLETDEDKYNYWLNFPTGISIDELNEEGIYVDPDGYRKDINEYEIGGGLHIYRVDGFEVTDFAKLCVMLSAITNICSEFKHSPCIPGADFFDIFGCYYLSERKIGKKPEITEYDTSYFGEYLAEWYFDFFDSPRIFEEKFNDYISMETEQISISDFEIIEQDSVIDSMYPKEIYQVKCKIHLK